MPSQSARSLTSFTALSFDVYATLIDWESGIYLALEPINSRLPASHSLKGNKRGLLGVFTQQEETLQEKYPDMNYAELLGRVYAEVATELGVTIEPESAEQEMATFGGSVGIWPAFPDSVEALKRLQKRYKLIVLSNVDGESFSRTLNGPLSGAHFDAVYTAQQIGTYKPDLRNFEYMVEHAEKDLGIKRDGFLHTAQALKHDHVPAHKSGLKCCWIERAGKDAAIGGSPEDFGDSLDLSFRFKTLGDMADAVDEAFANL
ncbi:Haloacid dehalogenase-like hydrolase-domain-containing protein [Dactylonectria estremocensis]|uniref:Haloacid dehalogenase-like hydrolase-domain-containing protein n=1 Tax=Dactylonectria estremocensis TaxID=1079267 RepID=A0A9P9F7R9_9HYPO|nr:Haloacid dehalogenase-like hydrolase-domain-containing protein [Dactylonectria estremocensis]